MVCGPTFVFLPLGLLMSAARHPLLNQACSVPGGGAPEGSRTQCLPGGSRRLVKGQKHNWQGGQRAGSGREDGTVEHLLGEERECSGLNRSPQIHVHPEPQIVTLFRKGSLQMELIILR